MAFAHVSALRVGGTLLTTTAGHIWAFTSRSRDSPPGCTKWGFLVGGGAIHAILGAGAGLHSRAWIWGKGDGLRASRNGDSPLGVGSP